MRCSPLSKGSDIEAGCRRRAAHWRWPTTDEGRSRSPADSPSRWRAPIHVDVSKKRGAPPAVATVLAAPVAPCWWNHSTARVSVPPSAFATPKHSTDARGLQPRRGIASDTKYRVLSHQDARTPSGRAADGEGLCYEARPPVHRRVDLAGRVFTCVQAGIPHPFLFLGPTFPRAVQPVLIRTRMRLNNVDLQCEHLLFNTCSKQVFLHQTQ